MKRRSECVGRCQTRGARSAPVPGPRLALAAWFRAGAPGPAQGRRRPGRALHVPSPAALGLLPVCSGSGAAFCRRRALLAVWSHKVRNHVRRRLHSVRGAAFPAVVVHGGGLPPTRTHVFPPPAPPVPGADPGACPHGRRPSEQPASSQPRPPGQREDGWPAPPRGPQSGGLAWPGVPPPDTVPGALWPPGWTPHFGNHCSRVPKPESWQQECDWDAAGGTVLNGGGHGPRWRAALPECLAAQEASLWVRGDPPDALPDERVWELLGFPGAGGRGGPGVSDGCSTSPCAGRARAPRLRRECGERAFPRSGWAHVVPPRARVSAHRRPGR